MIAPTVRTDTELRVCRGNGEREADGDSSELNVTEPREQTGGQGECKVEEGPWQDGDWQ